ncbi:lysophospholipid acyltransferase family protein [Mammaliicoccus stepanovicii]|uniref:1-acyl-sn-glycerol-3-phosphate acyltransferase n=1 Tax=Mammaliicoccus stepanovicii TaxID=643214 RepID=A0A239Z1E9_9STAP|nr:lysophospholipid acyltransferase family protein [Mammaliicoccus stepanovicii]PNZ73584.1 1-acyl-sn-glycerol-3-phosphate acyltransferase [Mammaliicoccus stepanovicii]GGI40405.1 1-acyl-sn-glycerol-3-phosphate acyltransferase [Mammaliicoccus stepanovicii]SNV64334.1 1-acyl-sn-glycerol-3-phosphate acyltransferase [Mammaliicoccus stepanovicii]
MYKFASTVLHIVFQKFGKQVIAINKEKVPDQPYIVTCTHSGYVEVIMLALSLYPTEINYMAKKELFSKEWSNKFFHSLNAFPVDREKPGPSTLKIPVKLLNKGKSVGIFPSGQRVESGEAPLKRGAATISVLSNKPIVPAAFAGPKEVKQMFAFKYKSFIKFGDPIDPNQLPSDMKKSEKIAKVTELLEERTKELQREVTEIAEKAMRKS